MYVLAFDRDWTVDVNPHPRKEAVPLEWVRYWAHETAHEVWAIGNQDLVEEAAIPGTVESIRRRDGDIEALGHQDANGYYEWWPKREQRLHILADLFPNAERYIVVDDLDLDYVDGWEHFHAWDFMDFVRDGDLDLATPPSTDFVPDGGLESEEAVKEILQEAYVFELTYLGDDEERTHLVTHVEPERPSMKPLTGPPAFWFDPVGSTDRFSVRLPDLEAIHPIPDEQLDSSASNIAIAAVREALEDDPAMVERERVHELLVQASDGKAPIDVDYALELAQTALTRYDKVEGRLIESTLELLAQPGATPNREVLTALTTVEDQPVDILGSHVPTLADLASSDHPARSAAVKLLMDLAEVTPEPVIDAIPALESAVREGDENSVGYAVYTLSIVAAEYPEQVFPATPALIDALEADNETIQTNALAAIGKIASNYPDAAEPIVEDVVRLLESDAKRGRNNAVGLLADLAQMHPDLVIEYVDQISARLKDNNIQARVNAAIALNRAGEADPSAIREQANVLEAALDDPSPEVRANVCMLIGNAFVPVSEDALRKRKQDDLDQTVRERAGWALQRLE